MGEFRMPSLGADMESGTVTEWLVAPGDRVRRGQIVAVVETEKSDIEIEIFEDGVIETILVPVGTEVAIGTALAIVAATGEAAPVATVNTTVAAPAGIPSIAPTGVPPIAPTGIPSIAPAPARPVARPATPSVISPLVRRLAGELHVDINSITPSDSSGVIHRRDVEAAAASTRRGPERVIASPYARRRARELHVDLNQLGTQRPRITARDVEAAAVTQSPTTPRARADRQQRAIGRLMERSKREIPHYYLAHDVDCEAMLTWMREYNAVRSVDERLLPAALLLRAVVKACATNPAFNGHFIEGAFVRSEHVQLGVAVATRGGGLVAPVIASAEVRTLTEFMHELRDLVTRTRKGTLRGGDVANATITVTNLGEQGVESLFGVIIPPQVAIVGIGRITERPRVVNATVEARPVATLSLSGDHRVSDGHRGARFLREIERLVADPKELL